MNYGGNVKVQSPQIPTTQDTNLFEPTYDQKPLDRSFDQYLEEEKKRLNAMFSPLGQFNFNGLFGYAPDTAKSNTKINQLNIFSDLDSRVFDQNSSTNKPTEQYSTINNNNPSSAQQLISQLTNNQTDQPNKIFLQQLLAQTGWLTPNIEAQTQLLKAQMQGTLLSSLDMQALVDQITAQVQLVKDKGQTQLRLGLKPDNLGEILLTLTARSGMIAIQIQAPEETRKLIEAKLQELELALKKMHINFSEIKILALEENKEAKQNA